MNINLVLGISVAVFVGYLLLRRFLAHSATAAACHREIEDLLTNKKYQVKGKFD